MKTMHAFALVVVVLFCSNLALAQEERKRTINGYDVAIDLVLRPAAFVGMVAGTALFIGLSPLTAFSQAFPPHDSFEKLAKLLIVQPAKYTFSRPVGDYTMESTY